MPRSILTLLAVIALAGAAFYFFNREAALPAAPSEGGNEYVNETYRFSFRYSDGYLLDERDMGTRALRHHHISLFEDTPFVRDLLGGSVTGTEAPAAISVDVWGNTENQPLETWVRGNVNSNFNLSSDRKIATTTVAGVPALSYEWDGLYRGQSLVLAHKGNILMLSVTSLSPEDKLLEDFPGVVLSFKLLP